MVNSVSYIHKIKSNALSRRLVTLHPTRAIWLVSVCLVLGLCCFVETAHPALEKRLGGKAYYDTVLDITWYTEANGAAGTAWDDGLKPDDGWLTWASAADWAAIGWCTVDSPIFMMEPLPKRFSIWPIASSRALSLSVVNLSPQNDNSTTVF